MNKKIIRCIAIAAVCVTLLLTALTGCMAAPADGAGSDDASAAAAGGLGIGTMVIYLVVIIAVFYFFMIRPEKKRKKKNEEMRNSLSVGDNVTTIGGMVGKIVNVSGDFITFETGEDRVRIKIAKWGVSSTGKDAEEPDDKAAN